MKQGEIFEFLRELILDMKEVDADAIQPTSTFEKLELDSLDFVELQVAVKKKFKVDLLPETFASGEIANIEQLIGFISNETAAAQA